MLNALGFHSAAVSLLRPMEDALDCLGAVTLVPGCAESWQDGKLKASKAAELWTDAVTHLRPRDLTLPEYRRYLRRDFNFYSHCTKQLCNWNLFFQPSSQDSQTDQVTGSLELNVVPLVADRNAHSIDAFETAHLLEFLALVEHAYTKELALDSLAAGSLKPIKEGVERLMQQHDRHRCQEVRFPPEIARLNG